MTGALNNLDIVKPIYKSSAGILKLKRSDTESLPESAQEYIKY